MRAKTKAEETKGIIFVLISSFVYGIVPVISKLGYATGLNSFSIIFGRYGFGLVCFTLIVLFRKVPLKVTAKQFWWIMLVSVVGIIMIMLGFASYEHLSSGIASLLNMSYIIFVVIFELILKMAPLKKYKVAGILIAFVGILLVVMNPGEKVEISTLGITLMMISAVFGGLQIILFDQPIIEDLPIHTVYFWEMIPPFIVIPLVGYFGFHENPIPQGLDQWFWSSCVGFLQLVVGLVIFYTAVRIIGAGTASVLGVTEPMFAAIAGAIVFHEVITVRVIIGGLILLGSVLFVSYFQSKEMPESVNPIGDKPEEA